MRYSWALPAVLRVSLVLAAEHHTFNIHDDLLAYPQYEVHLADDYILEASAVDKLRHARSSSLGSSSSPEEAPSHVERYQPSKATAESAKSDGAYYYEEMVLPEGRFLCALPIVQVEEFTGSPNDTKARKEQEKELARANARGWDLLSGMQGKCIYYHVDWWSYKYCHDSGARQFHMLAQRGQPQWPPVEDTNIPGFNLGLQVKADGAKKSDVATTPKQGELAIKGGSRYLVQRLDGGDRCDLTTLHRKVEVQFHCNANYKSDTITSVAEISTCTYLMIIETPRLCNDVAFQPPVKEKPHNITCQPVLHPDEVEMYEEERARELARIQKESSTKKKQAKSPEVPPEKWVGDIQIGERRFVPQGVTIEKSAIVGGKDKFIVTIATSKGYTMSKAELEKWKLAGPERVEELKATVIKAAKGSDWRIDVYDTFEGREYRGIHGDEEFEDPKTAKKPKSEKGDNQGSEEEFFKEEL